MPDVMYWEGNYYRYELMNLSSNIEAVRPLFLGGRKGAASLYMQVITMQGGVSYMQVIKGAAQVRVRSDVTR
jgi:hypothetical protein